MIRLAEEFFDAKNDPEQIAVDEAVMERLQALDPASLAQEANEDGPIAWGLGIPTMEEIMHRFLAGSINERELLELTSAGRSYEAVYLCSALVLPEFRKKGMARKLTVNSIREILARHPVRTLFYWSFSEEGTRLAESVASAVNLPLLRRKQ